MTTDEHQEHSHSSEDQSWFERNVGLIIAGLVIACVVSLLAELIWHGRFFDEKHPPHFPSVENIYFYSAAIGFVAFVSVVYLGKLLRVFVQRAEDYYDK